MNIWNQWKLDFWFYFDRKEEAEEAKNELEKHGFALTNLGKTSDDRAWLCIVTKSADPQQVRRLLEDIAKRFKGKYHGWETPWLNPDTLEAVIFE